MSKTVYIAHPVSGDVGGNVKKILDICHKVHTQEHVTPVAPYLIALQYLDDGIHEERELGIEANVECLKRSIADEIWLYGDRISNGMQGEIILAWKLQIPIKPMTPETKSDYEKLLSRHTSLRI